VAVDNPKSHEQEWWARVDGQLMRWRLEDGRLFRLVRQGDGSTQAQPADGDWRKDSQGHEYFWGVTIFNSAILWYRAQSESRWALTEGGLRQEKGGAKKYLPLRKGLLRGDPGMSLQYNRPVSRLLAPRIRNTAILAAAAFAVVMPLALFLGILAGVREGSALDRIISVTGLVATATPEYVTGIFLIMVFGIWLKIFPAVTLFTTSAAVLANPKMLVLPVLTLTAVELGYVARLTRTSMVEVMASPYIRTAIVKGMPYWRVVIHHAIRNALMAPITIIMLHINWLIGGVVVVEVIFGYPGLGKYIYDAAIFGDYNAVEAATMVTVGIAVATRLIGDFGYTLLNPRIRYS
jgi:peptide/nickel transport system permease protein